MRLAHFRIGRFVAAVPVPVSVCSVHSSIPFFFSLSSSIPDSKLKFQKLTTTHNWMGRAEPGPPLKPPIRCKDLSILVNGLSIPRNSFRFHRKPDFVCSASALKMSHRFTFDLEIIRLAGYHCDDGAVGAPCSNRHPTVLDFWVRLNRCRNRKKKQNKWTRKVWRTVRHTAIMDLWCYVSIVYMPVSWSNGAHHAMLYLE